MASEVGVARLHIVDHGSQRVAALHLQAALAVVGKGADDLVAALRCVLAEHVGLIFRGILLVLRGHADVLGRTDEFGSRFGALGILVGGLHDAWSLCYVKWWCLGRKRSRSPGRARSWTRCPAGSARSSLPKRCSLYSETALCHTCGTSVAALPPLHERKGIVVGGAAVDRVGQVLHPRRVELPSEYLDRTPHGLVGGVAIHNSSESNSAS